MWKSPPPVYVYDNYPFSDFPFYATHYSLYVDNDKQKQFELIPKNRSIMIVLKRNLDRHYDYYSIHLYYYKQVDDDSFLRIGEFDFDTSLHFKENAK